MFPFDQEKETAELLKLSLSAAVPLWIAQFQDRPWNELHRMIMDAGQIIAEHGDKLMYRSKKRGETAWVFNTLAKALAVMSFVPGGVTFLGMHFEAKHREPGMAVGTHRPMTFKAGTLGRFIQIHGIGIEARPAETNPKLDAVSDPWAASAHHYNVRLFREGGPVLMVPFSKGQELKDPPYAEEVLQTLAIQARDHELLEAGYEPMSPASQKYLEYSMSETMALKAFLGDAVYAELLDMAVEQKW